VNGQFFLLPFVERFEEIRAILRVFGATLNRDHSVPHNAYRRILITTMMFGVGKSYLAYVLPYFLSVFDFDSSTNPLCAYGNAARTIANGLHVSFDVKLHKGKFICPSPSHRRCLFA
jgi:hypothetical protein